MIKMDMHLHSNFSDGKNTIEEMAGAAVELGYEQIAFTDHVRRTTGWLDEYVAEINRVREKYPSIKIYSGIEAKILDRCGNIDAQEDFFKKVDIVLAAFHRIPKGEGDFLSKEEILCDKELALNLWYQAFMEVLENKNVHIIAHPTAILNKYNIDFPLKMKRDIACRAGRSGKFFEVNTRYRVPDDRFFTLLRDEGVYFSFGSDSHTIRELQESKANKLWKMSEEYNWEQESKKLLDFYADMLIENQPETTISERN